MPALNFSNLGPANLEELRGFASLPLNSVLKCSRDQTEARWREEITDLLSTEPTVGIAAKMRAIVCGFAICTPLPWESGLLGRSMWAIKHICIDSESVDKHAVATRLVAEVSRRAAAQGAEFLLCKTSALHRVAIHALESNGFLLMDTFLDFVYNCQNSRSQNDSSPQRPEGVMIRPGTSADTDSLVQIARACFSEHFGRFHADPRIGRAAAAKIYEEWIRSCANGWADWIFVAEHRNRIAGYSAWRKPSRLDAQFGIRLGHYSIAGVHPDFFGHGIFAALTRAGMNIMGVLVDWIEGPTHVENYAVQRGYQRLGWQIAGAQHSFHKWLQA
jgi:ribosomal protein S18 acetylase RimI-like enzyme